MTDSLFKGVALHTGDEIKAANRQSGKRTLFVGTSITQAVNFNERYLTWPNVVSNILGFECMNNGIGGTGYLATNNDTNYKYLDRMKYLIETMKLNPDIVIIEGGINDYSKFETSAVITEANNCYNYVKTNCPTAQLIVIGVYAPNQHYEDAELQLNTALKDNAIANHIPFIDLINGDTYDKDGNRLTKDMGPYITGTGCEGKEQNDGNADIYTSSDRIHPTVAGHKYLGEKLAEEINKID